MIKRTKRYSPVEWNGLTIRPFCPDFGFLAVVLHALCRWNSNINAGKSGVLLQLRVQGVLALLS